ncbi:hypothetical protein SDC9_128041 [bioreactor metagenome]|uniref:Uncharacterized protein n=1 Tax=bioreactor metagenome TaxID=1076179 RepID=A0A645CV06_9ZZZZ
MQHEKESHLKRRRLCGAGQPRYRVLCVKRQKEHFTRNRRPRIAGSTRIKLCAGFKRAQPDQPRFQADRRRGAADRARQPPDAAKQLLQ